MNRVARGIGVRGTGFRVVGVRASALIALALIAAACGIADSTAAPTGPAEPYLPSRDGLAFVSGVDHPYFPLVPGSRWTYEEHGARLEIVTVTVTSETREVDGVTCVVVLDEVSIDGDLVERTLDWYAQDELGNVWYFGEDSETIQNGVVVSHKGSWETGVNGAQAGLVMLATPEIGTTYRQEYRKGVAEDLAKVIELDQRATVAFGDFTDVLVTEDWNPLNSSRPEHKFYARGVGLVMERHVGGSTALELISFEPGGR